MGRQMTIPRIAGLLGLVLGALLMLWVPSSLASDPGDGSNVGAEAVDSTEVAEQFDSVDRTGTVASAADFAALMPAAEGRVQVIVGLRTSFTPEGALSPEAATAQHGAIAHGTQAVLRALEGTDFSVVHTYDTVPYVALRLSRGALTRLQRSGLAATLQEDVADEPTLAVSTRIVEATESSASPIFRSGVGQNVAILDTGVDKTHPFLQKSGGGTKVVSEACFSARANCPGGVTSSTAVGSGVPCTYAARGCTHGTHVAGIAAGRGASFSGVAPGANLLAIQVFSRFTGADCVGAGEDPCTRTFTSDQIKGLDRVFALRSTFAIASVNMSLGGGLFTSNCDTDSRKPSIDNLRSVGIATVIASGNDGSNTRVSAPGCISTAITVGSTDKSPEVVSSFSNSSSLVELLAPGRDINSSIPGGGFGFKSGTSMATPHVAGAWAVLKAISSLSVATILSHLQTTGKPVTDPDNNVTKPRIRILAAGARIRDTGFTTSNSFIFQGGDLASNGIGLATRAGGPSSGNIVIGGIPFGATIRAAFLYWTTIGGPDPSVVFQGVSRTGTLIGASRNTCWQNVPGTGQVGPNRTYRASIPLSSIPAGGNGSYSISGVGGFSGIDGQGASLLLVYSRSVANTGRIFLRQGAMSAVVTGETMSTTFTGLFVPSTPTQVRLHTAFGDGQSAFTEDPMLFRGSAITPANSMDGTDGRMWDDDRWFVSTALLPAGTASAVNSIRTGTDCLVWAYSALQYTHT